ncbi:MAG: hypothetical protein SH817_10775 [Leptospira sp.]|nr:hypothetical protein [Leptospira sp.]
MEKFHLTIIRCIIAGMAFMLGCLTMGLLAVTISGTVKSWSDGDRLTANDLNTTIESLKTAIESIPNWTKNGTTAVYNDGSVTINGKISSSVLGTYCGLSVSTTGNVGGYAAAKALCVTACGNSNAHMCSGHEIAISQQLGINVGTNAWFASYVRATIGAQDVNDCGTGFNSALASDGALVIASGSGVQDSPCNVSRPIACCF